MSLTALALCSRALLRLGAQPVASLTEGTAEAEVAANLYPGIRDAVLSAHPWSFATGQSELARLAATPVADHAHAFQLPPGFLRALSAGIAGRGRGSPIASTKDGCMRMRSGDADPHLPPDESAFPPFFAACLVAAWRPSSACR
jgi:hypothetical protein